MKCDNDPCQNHFEVPEVTVAILDRTQGGMWGFYCGHQCAKVDSQQALLHLTNGNQLDTLPNVTIDPETVNQPVAENIVPAFTLPTPVAVLVNDNIQIENFQPANPFTELDPEFETLLNAEAEIENALGQQANTAQTAWNHVVENTPIQTDGAEYARQVGNTLVQLFCANLGFQAEQLDNQGGYQAVIGVGRDNVTFQVRLTDDNQVEIYFGEGNEGNTRMNPNDPAVDMAETGPWLLQRVSAAWTKLHEQNLLTATVPNVGF